MSKKAKRIVIKNDKVFKGNPTAEITKLTNKKGKLKGKSRKKYAHMCTGHIYNDRGKVKPRIKVVDGWCECKICGEKFPAKLYEPKFIKEHIDEENKMFHQYTFLSESMGCGKDTTRYLTEARYKAVQGHKIGKRLVKMASKKQKISGKIKNKKNSIKGGTESYGSWG